MSGGGDDNAARYNEVGSVLKWNKFGLIQGANALSNL